MLMQANEQVLEHGPLRIDLVARVAWLERERLDLTRQEFRILAYLAHNPTRVFTKAELLRDLWGYAHGVGTTRTLDSHTCRLRKKLDGRFVMNVWGVGYRLDDPTPTW